MKPACRCPRCNVKGLAAGQDTWKCPRCGGFFDDRPEEGGDYSDRDPARRLEREEERRGRKVQRRT